MIWMHALLDNTPPASITTSTSPAPRGRSLDVDRIETVPFRLRSGIKDRNRSAIDEDGNASRKGAPNPGTVK